MMRRLSVLLACGVMALTLIAIAAGVSAAAPKQQPPPLGPSGVLYYSDTGLWWATGADKTAADKAAAADCRAANDGPCVLAVWVNNGWAAYTEGKDAQGVASVASWGRTEAEAAANGMAGCQDSGATGCATIETFETAFDPNKPTTGGFK